MLPTISDDPKFERMFLDEARIASKIRHNHVVEILDLGEQNAVLYLVMEWVDGESLSAIRRFAAEHGGVPVAVAVRIIADVCSGLHAAHELCDDEGQPFGLVHRDVSPQNILVGYDGVAKVLDFGVAKVAGRASETTNVGHARGKPPYMAPEQAMGHVVDRRADIFSLGIVLYQLIAGKHPFRGENDIATLHNIISDQPVVSPKAFVASLTEGLERVMLQALERDPEKRFQTAREMELALEALLDAELGRVRIEEIGRLVSTWLGPRGEDRRHALREAIRRADNAEATLINPTTIGPALRHQGTNGVNRGGGAREEPSETSSETGRSSPFDTSGPGDGDIGTQTPQRRSNVGSRVSSPFALKPDTEVQERTVVDLHPNWRVTDSAVQRNEAKTIDGVDRMRRGRTMALIVLLAMCTGALITWASYGLSRRAKPSSDAVPTITAPTSPSLPSMNPSVQHNAVNVVPVVADSSQPDAGAPSTVPTVTTDPRSTRVVRPNTTQGRKRPSGPTYNLPPVPSPGF
jgi:serine/threonine protein kinase